MVANYHGLFKQLCCRRYPIQPHAADPTTSSEIPSFSAVYNVMYARTFRESSQATALTIAWIKTPWSNAYIGRYLSLSECKWKNYEGNTASDVLRVVNASTTCSSQCRHPRAHKSWPCSEPLALTHNSYGSPHLRHAVRTPLPQMAQKFWAVPGPL